jgi:hypothetical protein
MKKRVIFIGTHYYEEPIILVENSGINYHQTGVGFCTG